MIAYSVPQAPTTDEVSFSCFLPLQVGAAYTAIIVSMGEAFSKNGAVTQIVQTLPGGGLSLDRFMRLGAMGRTYAGVAFRGCAYFGRRGVAYGVLTTSLKQRMKQGPTNSFNGSKTCGNGLGKVIAIKSAGAVADVAGKRVLRQPL
jgi:hypothetical protein